MWNWCVKCNKSSPALLMSPITWSFSLAKYLQIWLYAGSTGISSRTNQSLSSKDGCEGRAGGGLVNVDCGHALHQSHHRQMFYCNERVTVVSYHTVPVRNMVLPPTPLPLTTTPPSKDQVLRDLKTVTDTGYSVFEHISEHTSSGDLQLMTHFQRQKMHFKALIDNIQLQLTSHKVEEGCLQPALRVTPVSSQKKEECINTAIGDSKDKPSSVNTINTDDVLGDTVDLTNNKDAEAPGMQNKFTGTGRAHESLKQSHLQPGIKAETMLSVQDKLVLLHRIVIKSHSYWHQ